MRRGAIHISNTLLGGKNRLDREDTDRIGVAICQETFTRAGFIFREQKICDYGIDAIIEPKSDNYASGKLMGVQIKSGQSYIEKETENSYVFRSDEKHYKYWLNNNIPVIIVLVDTDEEKRMCYWQKFDKNLVTVTGKGWKLEIPKKNVVRETGEDIKRILDSQSASENKLNTLIFSREWMLAAREHENLILEVSEWINKTSGKGEFKLYYLDDENSEQIVFEQTYYGFGTRDYSLVIKDMFPWADVKIDENFYEIAMDSEWHNEYEEALESLQVNLLSQGRALYQRDETIYPYENCAGEVDKYRLLLTLNDLGRSFLLLMDFLNDGECYYLS